MMFLFIGEDTAKNYTFTLLDARMTSSDSFDEASITIISDVPVPEVVVSSDIGTPIIEGK